MPMPAFILLLVAVSCNKEDDAPPDEIMGTTIEPPLGAFPIVEKTFQYLWSYGFTQSFQSLGYGVEGNGEPDCGLARLTSDATELEVPEIYHNGMGADTAYITYRDVAINSTCETASSAGEKISSAFVLFGKTSARGGTAQPALILEGNAQGEFFKYVSTVRFALSATATGGSGLALYKSVNLDEYTLAGTFMPKEADRGEWFGVTINESNVNLKFVPMSDNAGHIRMHDLAVYTEGVPKNAKIWVDEQFNDLDRWSMEGIHAKPDGSYPPIPYVDYTPEIPEGREHPEGDDGVKGLTLVAQALYEKIPDIRKEVTYPSGATVTYTIADGAVNPYCFNHHGNLSLVWQLTKGYIDLPVWKSGYPRQEIIDASLKIEGLPSVSTAEFWLSTDSMECHYEVWYKTKDFAEYRLLKRYVQQQFSGIGKYMRLAVNADEVSFIIRPGEGSRNGEGYLLPNGKKIAAGRKTKVHGMRIWSR
jgi:hypothetical protein